MKLRRYTALLLAAATLLTFAACGNEASDADEEREEEKADIERDGEDVESESAETDGDTADTDAVGEDAESAESATESTEAEPSEPDAPASAETTVSVGEMKVDDYSYFTFSDGNTFTLYCNGEAIGSYDSFDCDFWMNKNSSGSVNILCTEDGARYYIDGKQILPLDFHYYSALLPDHGSKLAYILEDAEENYSLNLYDTADGSDVLIHSDIDDELSVVISPSLDGIAFRGVNADRKRVCYLWFDGQLSVIPNAEDPVALSDNAKYIYYRDEKHALYAVSFENGIFSAPKKLSPSYLSSSLFSSDRSEVIYVSDGKVYYYNNSAEPRVICDIVRYYDLYLLSPSTGTDPYGKLVGNYYKFNDKIYGFDETLGFVEAIPNVGHTALDTDRETLYFTQSGYLYKTSLADGMKHTMIYQSGVRDFICVDGNGVYFTDEFDGTLLYYDGSKTVTVSKNTVFMASLGNGCITFTSDNGLFVAKDGVANKLADGYIYPSTATNLICYADENGNCFVSTANGAFKPFESLAFGLGFAV